MTTPRPRDLDPAVAAELREMVANLPPLTDEQQDALADVLVQVELGRGQ